MHHLRIRLCWNDDRSGGRHRHEGGLCESHWASTVGVGTERYFVVVDEDIDITDINHVLWTQFTRVDPAETIHALRTLTTAIDPRLSSEKRTAGDMSMGIVLIDACKPFTWKDSYPKANRFDDAARGEIRDRWNAILPL
ncbi:hypothetical protein [Nocardia sp. NPDC059239]|uniref:hypothetical protein n=1 Tax=unclassified Nocardia TaxID=2637762 RepID=UPI0036BFD2BB